MTNVDYAATYFKYLVPSLINVKTINKTLKRLKTELCANGSSVDTDLRGDDHSYLGLIITDQEYMQINLTPTQLECQHGLAH